MRWLAVLAAALRRLRQRPVRTFLLLQGTIWGVAVAVFPSAVIQGTREAARQEGRVLGADRVSMRADTTSSAAAVLVRDDLRTVRAAVREEGTALRGLGGARVARTVPDPEQPAAPLTVLECVVGTEVARGHTLAAGRWLAPDDGPTRCVVEAGVGAWLGRAALAPGDRIQPTGWPHELEVVGVCAPRPAQALRTNDLGFDLEHPLYKKVGVPLLFAMGIMPVPDDWKRSELCVHVPMEGTDELHWVFLRVEPALVGDVANRVRDRMTDADKSVVMLYPLVLPLVMGEKVERFDAVNLAMFLACLLMGAVVMMNLGLLSALTRAREIAIRRTEGATKADIALQFLAEGLMLALVGAGLGCVLGMGLAHLRASLEPVAGFTWTFPVQEGLVAVSVAVVIGLLASLLPALRAASQDPVQGLADE